MKKKLCLAVCTLLGILSVGCGSSEKLADNVQEVETVITEENRSIKVGLISSIASLPLLIAEEQGYFDEVGLQVEMEYFKAAKDRDAALQAGELDGVLCDQIAIAIYQSADINMQITGKTDGTTSLIAGAQSGITSIEELVGKKIAISENTMIEYTLDKVLEAAGVDVTTVEKVSIPSMPTRLEMLASGEIDAAVMPNPYSDIAIADGNVCLEVVESTSDLYTSVTAFKQEVIDTNAEAIKAYYEAYNKAVEYINHTDMSAYEDIIIETIGYPETMRGNMVIPQFNANTLPTTKSVQAAFTWATEKGLLTKELTPADVLNKVAFQ